MTLPDDQLKSSAKDGLSSGGEDGVLGPGDVNNNNNDDSLQLPPAGYQLLSPNPAAPQPQSQNSGDDDSDFEASTDSDDPEPPCPLNGAATISEEIVEEKDLSKQPEQPSEDGKSNFEWHTRQEISEVWWSTNSNETAIQTDHCDKIKECLSTFQLPAENVPSWAQQIPEGQWKDVLLDRLKKINQKN